MTANLLLRGGPGHDFEGTSAVVVDALAEVGIATDVVDDPDEAVARLAAAEVGHASPIDLFTVDALRWSMRQARYDGPGGEEVRRLHAYRLPDEGAGTIDRFVRSGGGVLALHTAVICFDADPRWHALCGAVWRWGESVHPPVGPAAVRVTPAGRAHPVTAGVDDFEVVDEVYGFLDEVADLEPLLTSFHGGRHHPVVWAREVGDGRVATDLLGHDPASFEHPTHRRIVQQAAAWACRLPLAAAREAGS